MLNSEDNRGNLDCTSEIALTFLKFDHSGNQNLGMVFRCSSCAEVVPFMLVWRSPAALLIAFMPDSKAEQTEESHNSDAALHYKRGEDLTDS